MIHSTTGSISQIITGLLNFNFIGLIVGRLIGLFSCNLNYVRKYLKNYTPNKKKTVEWFFEIERL